MIAKVMVMIMVVKTLMKTMNKQQEMFEGFANNCYGSSSSEAFLGNIVLKICSKFTGEHACRSVILIKLLCNFIKITLLYGCYPVNLLHIFRIPFYNNTYGGLLLLPQNSFTYSSKRTN